MSKVAKMKVIESKSLDSGLFSNKLNHRVDTTHEDKVLGTVVTTKSDYYYVKTAKPLPEDTELELDMNNYDIEVSEFKNRDEASEYYGEQMTSNWLVPKGKK